MKHNPQIKTILYASDLGPNTRPVFRFALSLAEKYDAEVIMVHIVEPISSTAEAMISTYLSSEVAETIQKDGMRQVNEHIKERLTKFCEEESPEDKGYPDEVTETIVANGKPSEEILRIAEEHQVDLIVMGKSTRTLRGKNLMGSCSRRITRHAKVPVLVIPND